MLIDKLYDVGISISYDRVLGISTELGNKVIDQFSHDKVVYPPSLKVGAFTTAAIDNIDHNQSPTLLEVHFMYQLYPFFSILL